MQAEAAPGRRRANLFYVCIILDRRGPPRGSRRRGILGRAQPAPAPPCAVCGPPRRGARHHESRGEARGGVRGKPRLTKQRAPSARSGEGAACLRVRRVGRLGPPKAPSSRRSSSRDCRAHSASLEAARGGIPASCVTSRARIERTAPAVGPRATPGSSFRSVPIRSDPFRSVPFR